MVHLAFEDNQFVRVRRRTTLLCACAIAALVADPALAVAGGPGQSGDLAASRFSVDRGMNSRRIEDVPSLPDVVRGPPALGNPEAGSGPMSLPSTVTGQGSTFDVQVQAPTSRVEAATTNAAPRDDQVVDASVRAALGPEAPPSLSQVERMLVISHAPPAAESARIDDGAIILSNPLSAAAPETAKLKGALSAAEGGGHGNANPPSPTDHPHDPPLPPETHPAPTPPPGIRTIRRRHPRIIRTIRCHRRWTIRTIRCHRQWTIHTIRRRHPLISARSGATAGGPSA